MELVDHDVDTIPYVLAIGRTPVTPRLRLTLAELCFLISISESRVGEIARITSLGFEFVMLLQYTSWQLSVVATNGVRRKIPWYNS